MAQNYDSMHGPADEMADHDEGLRDPAPKHRVNLETPIDDGGMDENMQPGLGPNEIPGKGL